LRTRHCEKGVYDFALELFACLRSKTLRERLEQRTSPLVTGQQGLVELGIAPDGILQSHDRRLAPEVTKGLDDCPQRFDWLLLDYYVD